MTKDIDLVAFCRELRELGALTITVADFHVTFAGPAPVAKESSRPISIGTPHASRASLLEAISDAE